MRRDRQQRLQNPPIAHQTDHAYQAHSTTVIARSLPARSLRDLSFKVDPWYFALRCPDWQR